MARVPTNEPREAENDRQGSGEPAEGAVEPMVKNKRGKAKSAHAPLSVTDGWDELEIPADDRYSYRMSSLGGDLTQLVAGALEVASAAPPGWLAKYLDEGTEAEAAILTMFYERHSGMRRATFSELSTLKAEGVIAGYDPNFDVVKGTGGPQVWLEVGTKAVVKGHPDDIARINPNGDEPAYAVLEAKKFRPTLWRIWTGAREEWDQEPTLAKYAWQVSAQLWATGLPVYFVVGQFNPDTGQIDDIDVTLITEANVPHSAAEIKARVMKAQTWVLKGEIPPCEKGDDTCPYRDTEHCLGKKEKAGEDLDDVELGRLLGLYYAYSVDMSQTEEQKEASKLRDAVKKEIDKLVADRGYARSKGDDAHVFHVWDEAGNEYEYEWVVSEVKARAATTSNRLNVKLIIDSEATDAEDHPE